MQVLSFVDLIVAVVIVSVGEWFDEDHDNPENLTNYLARPEEKYSRLGEISM